MGSENKTRRIDPFIGEVDRMGATKQQLPANPELLWWERLECRRTKGEMENGGVAGCDYFGFPSPLLRIIEVGNLEDRDVPFQESGGKQCITIMIRGSKTDHHPAGLTRTLTGTKCDLCPVVAMATCLDLKGWRANNGESLFIRDIENRINNTLEELGAGNRLGGK